MLKRMETDMAAASAPEHVEQILRNVADTFNEAATELSAAWQDREAGKCWGDFARILERAAEQCEKIRAKRGC